jgi:protein-tyrosine phosphatase
VRPLLDVSDAVDPAAPGLWWARREPSPLVGMFAPTAGFRFDLLADRQVGAIVSLIGPQTYDAGSLRTYVFSLHDLYRRREPADPVAERAELAAAAGQVARLVVDGVGVAVHCRAGIGRTGTVIGAVLVSLGYPSADVAAWLDAVQRARGCPGWPESPWQLDSLDILNSS